MVMTTQSSPCRNGLRRSISARCFCASISRSRCCCRMRFCCSSSVCCWRPPSVPPGPPAPVPPSCRAIASRCSGERPCIICRLSMELPRLCPLAGPMKSDRAVDNASRQKLRNGRKRKSIRVLHISAKQRLYRSTSVGRTAATTRAPASLRFAGRLSRAVSILRPFFSGARAVRYALAPSPPPLLHRRQQPHHRCGRRMASARILHRRRKLLGEPLAELDAPLVERVDAPDDALREHAVLIKRDELTQGCRIELLEQHDGARTAPRVDLVRDERLEPRRRHFLALEIRAHGLRGLPGHEGLRLCQAARDREVLLGLVAG